MRIITDKDILAVDHCFSRLGKLVKVPGREIDKNLLQNADALLVRSITTVDEELLHNSNVKFVASATAGIDHINITYLKNRGIGFAHAPGANANAVVDYCFAALAKVAIEMEMTLAQFFRKEFAIVGAGNVGGLFHKKLQAMGVNCRVCDPILQQQSPSPNFNFCSLDQAMSADIVSLHVPLTLQGPHATLGMIRQDNLSLLPRNAIVLNTSRGGVIEEQALKELLCDRIDVNSIVDVWGNEPDPDLRLVDLVDVATPHIAGYSMDAKNAATKMIAAGFAKFFAVDNSAEPKVIDAEYDKAVLELELDETADNAAFKFLLQAFSVSDLSEVFKTLGQREMLGEYFDILRTEVAQRREFFAYRVVDRVLDDNLRRFLSAVGIEGS